VAQGASYLHLVDLDGAKAGHPVNGDSIRQVLEASGVPCQLGGGLRSTAHIREALGWGVARVVLGTRGMREPGWLELVANQFPGQVALGIDAKNGQVATDGWLNVSAQSALELARQCASLPLAAVVYTDINRDGMLEGPNFETTAELTRVVPFPVIASGGITTVDDIRRLAALGVPACIVGRALYEGRLDLAAIIQEVASRTWVASKP
jgi:phosphoribosylformimino-5-aminoimidazole carboxamide ribotide isomerase